MSKNIDIDNEEEILKECDFDYFYNSENCSRELCAFYNDIWRNGNNEKFDKRQALIDLGRIGIVLNNQIQQIAQLKAENERLKQQLKEKYEQLEAFNTLLSCGTYTTPNTDIWLILIKQNTQQVCEKIREWIKNQIVYCGGKANEVDILTANASNQVLEDLKQFLDQIENEKLI